MCVGGKKHIPTQLLPSKKKYIKKINLFELFYLNNLIRINNVHFPSVIQSFIHS